MELGSTVGEKWGCAIVQIGVIGNECICQLIGITIQLSAKGQVIIGGLFILVAFYMLELGSLFGGQWLVGGPYLHEDVPFGVQSTVGV